MMIEMKKYVTNKDDKIIHEVIYSCLCEIGKKKSIGKEIKNLYRFGQIHSMVINNLTRKSFRLIRKLSEIIYYLCIYVCFQMCFAKKNLRHEIKLSVPKDQIKLV